MGLVLWIIIGLALGWVASRIMQGRGARLQSDLIVGAGGAVIGGLLATLLLALPNAVAQINPATIIWSALGSALALVILQFAARRNRVR